MENILGFTNHRTCVRETVLLHYYLFGFWWAKEARFTPTQTSFTMAVLHMLLENLREKQMSSVDNLVVLIKAIAVACHCSPSDEDTTSLLDNNEAAALICYVTKRLVCSDNPTDQQAVLTKFLTWTITIFLISSDSHSSCTILTV
ncbi:hypothetical protein GOODEAATRI_027213 [Goodea atripinnis]|uniref:Uncharacterized protein n=1 Tax=Goodea atripinnis TaxID=208336 RepID=A0ABV0NYC0_9TELE